MPPDRAPSEQLLTLTYAELTHPDDRHAGSSALRRAIAGRRTPVRSRVRFLRADGSVVWVQLTACPLFDDEDRPLYQLLQVEDLSARADAEAELLASQDPLTGLLTGDALHERMVDVLDRARRLDTTGVVLVCDLDRLTTRRPACPARTRCARRWPTPWAAPCATATSSPGSGRTGSRWWPRRSGRSMRSTWPGG